jgi:hypothetical protein
MAHAPTSRGTCEKWAFLRSNIYARLISRLRNVKREARWGELSGEERSDEAGQFVGKRAGSAAAVAQEGAKRLPSPRRRRCVNLPRAVNSPRTKNNSGRRQATLLVQAKS